MKKRHYLTQASRIITRFFWQILTLIAVFGWIILLIAAFSDWVSPLKMTYLPYFGLFFPFILAFNVLFLLFWLICKKWKQLLATMLVLAVCWGSIYTYFPIHRKTKQLPDDCIKVMTYNVMHFGFLQEPHTKNKPNPILTFVKEQDPDIVCFQEFSMYRGLTEAAVKETLKAMPYYHILPFGVAVFSKYPILSAERLPIDSQFNGVLVLELDIKGRKVTLVNNHLESNGISADERDGYYEFTKSPDKQKLETFTHMMFKRLTPAFKKRAAQVARVSETIRQSKNPYIIVCGDFNDTPISYARHTVKGDLTDAFVESGSGMGISFNTNRFLFRIDYILHSKNMKAYNCTVGKLKTSDHYPVWTYLQFKD